MNGGFCASAPHCANASTCIWCWSMHSVQVLLAFHSCGGNFGDDGNVTLPKWVEEAADSSSAWFLDRARGHVVNRELIVRCRHAMCSGTQFRSQRDSVHKRKVQKKMFLSLNSTLNCILFTLPTILPMCIQSLNSQPDSLGIVTWMNLASVLWRFGSLTDNLVFGFVDRQLDPIYGCPYYGFHRSVEQGHALLSVTGF